MNIERIPLDQIDASDRLRPVDQDQVLLIAASAAEDGIRTPIEVRPAKAKGHFLLVTGGHRLAVAQFLGHEDIPAIVLPKMSDDEARMREIDENVYRHDLSDLDRAVFLAEKKAIHERLNPHTKHGGDRKSDGEDQVAIFGHLAERFTAEVQERLGYSERTLRRIVKRATIPADVRARIAGTPFSRNGSELDALLKLDEKAQHDALDIVLGGRPDAPRSIAAAATLIAGQRGAPAKPEDEIQLGALMRAWRGAGAKARRRFVDTLVEDGDPIIMGVAERTPVAA